MFLSPEKFPACRMFQLPDKLALHFEASQLAQFCSASCKSFFAALKRTNATETVEASGGTEAWRPGRGTKLLQT